MHLLLYTSIQMITASHLPGDRNGFKFFSQQQTSGFTKEQVRALAAPAKQCASEWYNRGILPPSSGPAAVMCAQHEHASWMNEYTDSLKRAIQSKTENETPLQGLTVVLNAGNGSGGFFQKVLTDLGADAGASLHLEPNGAFPNGVPNPEDKNMLQQTVAACEAARADLGIMLDTDADRWWVVVLDSCSIETFEMCCLFLTFYSSLVLFLPLSVGLLFPADQPTKP